MVQTIKAGYKQTEVGVIPEDWDLELIKNVAQIKTGSKNTEDRVDNGTYPFFVRSQTVERINTFSYDGEAVLTAGDGVGVGKVMHYINGKFDCHQRVYRISDFVDRLNGFYFYLYFSDNFYNRIMQMTAKSSVDSVRMEMIAEMQIPLPPTKAEQTSIATALSDMDDLINSLSTLMEKKKAIKKGAMQELLKPKEGWVVKKLGEVVVISSGESPSKFEFIENGIPYFKVEQLNNGFIYAEQTEYFIYQDNPIPAGSIIFPKRGASIFLNKIRILRNPSFMDTNLMTITPTDEISNLFLFYSLMNIGLDQVADTTSIPQINNKHTLPFELPFPSKGEQEKIAIIISDMDNEISSLEKNLTKYQMLKQGMMQELLTGKKRLI